MRKDTRKKITREQGFALFDYLQHEEAEGRATMHVSSDQIYFEHENNASGFLTRFNGDGIVDHWRLTGMIDDSKVSFQQFTWMFPFEVFAV
jgi:hypothetical protein